MQLYNSPVNSNKTTRSLIILWVGALLLLLLMAYNWIQSAKGSDRPDSILYPKGIFVDELLLSAEELKLDLNLNLININRGRELTIPDNSELSQKTVEPSPERKVKYSKILNNKIRNISSSSGNKSFTIKPLPQ